MIDAKNYPINCGLLTSSFNRTFKKTSIPDRSFDLSIQSVSRITNNPSATTININQNNTPLYTVSRAAEASYVTDFIINVNRLVPDYSQNISLSSDDTSIISNPASLGPSQFLSSYQADGITMIKAQAEDGETLVYKINSRSEIGSVVDTFLSWANGSLAHHSTNAIDNLIGNKTATNIYTTANGSSFIRNSNCWISDVDTSCASPWNSSYNNLTAGTLISPRHIMFCRHYNFYPSIGSTIYFVSSSGQVVTKTLSSIQHVTSPNRPIDIAIGYLNSDVPNNIKYAKILPANWLTYLPQINIIKKIPIFWFNQNENASIYELTRLDENFISYPSQKYANFFLPIIRFDSGSPFFMLINNEPVLLGVLIGGGAGTFVSSCINEINSTMSSLGGTGAYQLTQIDLSSFNSY